MAVLLNAGGEKLTVKELAELADLAPNTVNQYLSAGRYQKYFEIDKSQGKAMMVGLPRYDMQKDAFIQLLYHRDGNSCIFCRRQILPGGKQSDIIHLTPESKKGPSVVWNMGACCKPCKQAKGKETAEAFIPSITKKKRNWAKNQVHRIRSLEKGVTIEAPEPSTEEIIKNTIRNELAHRVRWEYEDVLVRMKEQSLPNTFFHQIDPFHATALGVEPTQKSEQTYDHHLEIWGPEHDDWYGPLEDDELTPTFSYISEVADYYEDQGWDIVSIVNGKPYESDYIMLIRKPVKGRQQ